jgi:hypothetical protein
MVEITGAGGAAASMVLSPPPRWGVFASSLARGNPVAEEAACVCTAAAHTGAVQGCAAAAENPSRGCSASWARYCSPNLVTSSRC